MTIMNMTLDINMNDLIKQLKLEHMRAFASAMYGELHYECLTCFLDELIGDMSTGWSELVYPNLSRRTKNIIDSALQSKTETTESEEEEKEKKEVFYKVGDRFKCNSDDFLNGNIYILASCEHKTVVLINPMTGHRAEDSVKVVNDNKITEEELYQLCGDLNGSTCLTLITEE